VLARRASIGVALLDWGLVIGDDLRELLARRLPSDHARQTLAQDMAARALRAGSAPAVLDLGCGAGDSVGFAIWSPDSHGAGSA